MSAIEKMVEWLKINVNNIDRDEILHKANCLLKEEALEKTGLVEEFKGILIEAMGFGSLCWEPRPIGIFKSDMAIDYAEKKIAEILSRHEKGVK